MKPPRAREGPQLLDAWTPPPAKNGLWPVRGELASPAPKISILVLTLDGAPLLEALFTSFAAVNTYPDVEFIVVDHGSSDDTLALLERWSAELPVRVIARGQNFSYANSNNKAARFAQGELLLLLNNDVTVGTDCLGAMAEVLADPAVGAVGIKQFQAPTPIREELRIAHFGVRFEWSLAERRLKPRHVWPRLGDILLFHAPAAFPGATASFLMCRREDYLGLDGLHEGYVYGLEDLDLCCRLRLGRGRAIVCRNDHHAFHGRSRSRNRDRAAKDALELKNRRLFQRRWGYALRREFIAAKLSDDGSMTGEALTVGFALDKLDDGPPALGEALERLYGWRVRYLPREAWRRGEGLDVLVAMDAAVDPGAIEQPEPHLVTVAWAEGLDPRRFDLVLGAGEPAVLRAMLEAHLSKVRVSLKLGEETADTTALVEALSARGWSVRADRPADWLAPRSLADDVVIVMEGAEAYRPAPDQANIYAGGGPPRPAEEGYDEAGLLGGAPAVIEAVARLHEARREGPA